MPTVAIITLENIGRGPAVGITVECWWKDKYYRCDAPASLTPGKTREFRCLVEEMEKSRRPGIVIDEKDLLIRFAAYDTEGYSLGSKVESVPFRNLVRHGTKFDNRFTL